MILFLNFAPIDFMGGAERWMLDTATRASKREEVLLVDVHQKISSLYGRLVLGRAFGSRFQKNLISNTPPRKTLSFRHFIPFTLQWKEMREKTHSARRIYIRFELMEIAILLYFGGLSTLNKTIAGMHLNVLYKDRLNLWSNLHNAVYGSFIYKFLLKRTYKIHVINKREKEFLLKNFQLKNVVHIPNWITIKETIKLNQKRTNKNTLNVIFVGELSKRKGVDTILQVILTSPDYFTFRIVGDGPLLSDVEEATKHYSCIYHGYLHTDQLSTLYSTCDVLLFPSRAEAFGLVMLEAMQYGLKIVDSPEIALGLPTYIEYTAINRNPQAYISLLEKIYSEKREKVEKQKIRNYCIEHYSDKIIFPKVMKELFEISYSE